MSCQGEGLHRSAEPVVMCRTGCLPLDGAVAMASAGTQVLTPGGHRPHEPWEGEHLKALIPV